MSKALASPAPRERHPVGLRTLFFTELWERFSYYGMRALLVLFMTDAVTNGGLGIDDKVATAIYGLYTAMVYLVALPGGWIADRLTGAQRAVWIGGLVITAGHFTLAIPAVETFYLGLVLIVVGTGLLKPNVSVIVGHLYPEGGGRRDAGFTIFYMGINIGAALGPIACSSLAKMNWHVGFAAAGVGMLLAVLVFRITRSNLGDAGLHPERSKKRSPEGFDPAWLWVAAGLTAIAVVTALGLTRVIVFDPIPLAHYATGLILATGGIFLLGILLLGRLTWEELGRFFLLIVLLFAAAIFWAGFEQAGSSFNLFARDHTLRKFAALPEIPAGFFQSINPVLIIVLAPVVASIWVWLQRRQRNPSVPSKFALGLLLLGAGFLVMAWASHHLGEKQQVLPTWLLTTYTLHTLGELCLSPVGLSAVTKLSPQRFVGQMMGMWFLAASLGNVLAGLLAGEIVTDTQHMSATFLYLAMAAMGIGAALLLLAQFWRNPAAD